MVNQFMKSFTKDKMNLNSSISKGKDKYESDNSESNNCVTPRNEEGNPISAEEQWNKLEKLLDEYDKKKKEELKSIYSSNEKPKNGNQSKAKNKKGKGINEKQKNNPLISCTCTLTNKNGNLNTTLKANESSKKLAFLSIKGEHTNSNFCEILEEKPKSFNSNDIKEFNNATKKYLIELDKNWASVQNNEYGKKNILLLEDNKRKKLGKKCKKIWLEYKKSILISNYND